MKNNVAAILMASGFSKRFGGRNKLLLPFRGKPLALHTIELVSALDFPREIFFVAASDDVAALAKGFKNISVVKNYAPEKGLRESVRIGVEAAGLEPEYYIFFPCDQPLLDAETVERVLGCAEPSCIVEPRFGDKPGNPCLFSNVYRKELLSLKEGETPRLIKARHPEALRFVEVSNSDVLLDVDDEKTLDQLSKMGIFNR